MVIVGAGPAGLGAAALASLFGVECVLIDDQPRPGGQVFRQGSTPPALPFFARMLSGVYADPGGAGIDYRSEHTVWAFDKKGLYVCGPRGSYRLQARRTIIATGASEWVFPISGWTLPGVVTAGGAQTLIKTSGVAVGRRIAIAGTGPLLLQLAAQLRDAGAKIVGVYEIASFGQWLHAVTRTLAYPPAALQGIKLLAALASRGVRVQWGCVPSRILGTECVDGLEVSTVPGPLEGRRSRYVNVDAVCLSYGLVPSIELAALRGCDIRYSPVTGTWEVIRDSSMRTSIHDVYSVGDGARVGGARTAVIEGQLAACTVARDLGRFDERRGRPLERGLRRQFFLQRPLRSFLSATFRCRSDLTAGLSDDAVLCRCEEIHVGALREAVRDGVHTLRELRILYRVGMGPCQGRFCTATASSLLAQATGCKPESLGVGTPRPPIRPITIGQMTNNTRNSK